METLFDLPTPNPKHPAKYSDALMSAFVKMSHGCNKILDPFGGTGKVFLLNHWYPSAEIHAVEIEPEWAKINPRTTLGSALELPWQDDYFDCICTSPTYGNAMAGKVSKDLDVWRRIKYADAIRRDLNENNSANFQWGEKYRQFHVKAWQEATRVLCRSGNFILNIKNHIRDGMEQPVTDWHIETIISLGYEMIEHKKINVPSMRFGENREKRIEYESVILFALRSKRQRTPRALDGGDSAASKQFPTPEVLSTLQGESTPAHRK